MNSEPSATMKVEELSQALLQMDLPHEKHLRISNLDVDLRAWAAMCGRVGSSGRTIRGMWIVKPFKLENVWISMDACVLFCLYVEIKTYCCHLLPIIWGEHPRLPAIPFERPVDPAGLRSPHHFIFFNGNYQNMNRHIRLIQMVV